LFHDALTPQREICTLGRTVRANRQGPQWISAQPLLRARGAIRWRPAPLAICWVLRLTPCGRRPLSLAPPWKRRLCTIQENNNRTLSCLWGLLHVPFRLKIVSKSGSQKMATGVSKRLRRGSSTLRVFMETNEERRTYESTIQRQPQTTLGRQGRESENHSFIYRCISAA
jgi:hypothetical protein